LSRKAIAGLERRANDRKKTLPKMLNEAIRYMQTEFWDFAEGLDRETLVVPYGLCNVTCNINVQRCNRVDINKNIADIFLSRGHTPLVSFHLQQDPIIGEDVSPCIGGQGQASIGGAFYDYHGQDKRITELDNVSPTCVRQWGTGGNNVPLVAMAVGEDITNTQGGMCLVPPDTIPLDMRQAIKSSGKPWDNCGSGIGEENGKAYTLTSSGIVHGVVIFLDRASFNQGRNVQYTPGIDDSGKHFSEVAKGPGAVCFHRLVRRLTPKECERLQGYEDDYTKYGADGKIISDSARYRAIGNSIALPCMDYVMAKIAEDNRKRR
jgi:DNA (cytosine-5)-methyltransferase 1